MQGIKNVLRIPRLYRIYQDSMKAAGNRELMATFIDKQMKRLSLGKAEPDEQDYKESVRKCLEV